MSKSRYDIYSFYERHFGIIDKVTNKALINKLTFSNLPIMQTIKDINRSIPKVDLEVEKYLKNYSFAVNDIVKKNFDTSPLNRSILNKALKQFTFPILYYIDSLDNFIPSIYINYDEGTKHFFIKSKEDSDFNVPIENSKDIVTLKNMIADISADDIFRFTDYISTYPMLAFKHEIGSKIYEYIKNNNKEKVEDIFLYRIRKASNSKRIPFVRNEMFEPSYKTTPQNRFSSTGLNPLYFSENLEIAKSECNITEKNKYTWVKLKLVTPLKLLNICNKEIPLFDYCQNEKECKKQSLNVEYLLPNFVSDCAKELGFNGIIYNSIYDSTYKNYVLFDMGKKDFEVLELKGINYK